MARWYTYQMSMNPSTLGDAGMHDKPRTHLLVAEGVRPVIHAGGAPHVRIVHAPTLGEFGRYALVHLAGGVVRVEVAGKADARRWKLRVTVV